MTMITNTLTCVDPHDTHDMVYHQWGDLESARVLLCVHGLTRNSRDFDFLAAELDSHYRVVCPDVVGRGESEWLLQPIDYTYSVYVDDMLALLTELNLDKIDWLGTSMGGLIGMSIAAMSHSPIRRLILNDIGAFIPRTGLKRIGAYLTDQAFPRFNNLLEVEEYFRNTYTTFGQLSDVHWRHIAEHGSHMTENGSYILTYDPGIALPFQGIIEDMDLWSLWEKVTCPVLLLRGENSDLLRADIVAKMQEVNPTMHVVTFKGVGHAPALMDDEQIQVVKSWLLNN